MVLNHSDKNCKYCRNKAASGFQCTKCGNVFHNSCRNRVESCCSLPLTEKYPNHIKSTLPLDFSMEAYIFLKELATEQKLSNSLLMDKIKVLEFQLEEQKKLYADLECKYLSSKSKKEADKKTHEDNSVSPDITGNKNKPNHIKKDKQTPLGIPSKYDNKYVKKHTQTSLENLAFKQKEIMDNCINLTAINEEHRKDCILAGFENSQPTDTDTTEGNFTEVKKRKWRWRIIQGVHFTKR